MRALPVVVRELRLASRRGSTYWGRVSVAFVSILFACYCLVVFVAGVAPSGPANWLFDILASVAFIYCLFSGLRNASDCVSSEKREGTLGLLFLTDLKGYDVVLGKLFASGLHSFYSFLAAFPVMAICLMLGGVTGLKFWETALALLNVLFFAHAAGLLTSTFSTQARQAYSGAGGIVFIFLIGFPFLGKVLNYYHYDGLDGLLSIINPGYAVTNAGTSGRFVHYWLSLGLVHAISWGFLGLAAWRVPYCWQERVSAQRLRWRERIQNWCYGSAEVRRNFRHRLLGENVFFWLTSRGRLGPAAVWGVLGLIGCMYFWVYLRHSGTAWMLPTFITGICISHLLMLGWIDSASVRHFDEQRRNGSLEFLLSCTPLTVSEIVAGHWLSLRRQFLWPLFVLLLSDVVMLICIIRLHNEVELAWTILTVIIIMAVNSWASGWIGMWKGISTTKAKKSSGAALLRVLVFPWLITMLVVTKLKLNAYEILGAWLIITLLISVVLAARAKRQLFKNFRTLAGTPFEEPIGFWGGIGRGLGLMMRNVRVAGAAKSGAKSIAKVKL